MLRTLWTLSLVMLLTACGGGGGGGGGSPLLSFEPESIEISFASSTSQAFDVHGTLRDLDAITGELYILVEDPNGVLSEEFELYPVDVDTLGMTLKTSALLAKGTYTGKLYVHLCKDLYCNAEYGTPSSFSYTFNVTAAPLSLTPSTNEPISYSAGGAAPGDVQLSVNVDDVAWDVSSSAAWLVPSVTSGSGSTVLNLSVNPAGLPVGSHNATVTVVTADNQIASADFSIQVSERRLLPSTWGLGLTSSSTNRLQATLDVAVDSGSPVNWTATSDSAWLSVTPSGNTGTSKTISVNADAAALPAEQISYASITIAGDNPGVKPAVVKVALWKGSSASRVELTASYVNIAADPIRPWVYLSNGTSAIDVYNVHTGEKVTSITGADTQIGGMAVAPDGSMLYALDVASKHVRVIKLDTLTTINTWVVSQQVDVQTQLLVVRPLGSELVVVSGGYYGDGGVYTKGGQWLQNVGVFNSMAASADYSHLYTQNAGLSPSTLIAYTVDYSIATGNITLSVAAQGSGGSNGRDVAVGPMGVVTANGSPYACERFDPLNLASLGSFPDGSNAYPNNVEVSATGQTLCGISGWYSDYDFWVFSKTGTFIGAHKVAGYAKEMLSSSLRTSADGQRAIVLTSDPKLVFLSIQP